MRDKPKERTPARLLWLGGLGLGGQMVVPPLSKELDAFARCFGALTPSPRQVEYSVVAIAGRTHDEIASHIGICVQIAGTVQNPCKPQTGLTASKNWEAWRLAAHLDDNPARVSKIATRTRAGGPYDGR
jgi:hypothetical protein